MYQIVGRLPGGCCLLAGDYGAPSREVSCAFWTKELGVARNIGVPLCHTRGFTCLRVLGSGLM